LSNEYLEHCFAKVRPILHIKSIAQFTICSLAVISLSACNANTGATTSKLPDAKVPTKKTLSYPKGTDLSVLRDLVFECPEYSAPKPNIEYFGARLVLNKIDRVEKKVSAKLVPYFLDKADRIYTLKYSPGFNFGENPNIVRPQSINHRGQKLWRYLAFNNNINVRIAPGKTPENIVLHRLVAGQSVVGRGPIVVEIAPGKSENWIEINDTSGKWLGYAAERFFEKFKPLNNGNSFRLNCRQNLSTNSITRNTDDLPSINLNIVELGKNINEEKWFEVFDFLIKTSKNDLKNTRLIDIYDKIFQKYKKNTTKIIRRKYLNENSFIITANNFGFPKNVEVLFRDKSEKNDIYTGKSLNTIFASQIKKERFSLAIQLPKILKNNQYTGNIKIDNCIFMKAITQSNLLYNCNHSQNFNVNIEGFSQFYLKHVERIPNAIKLGSADYFREISDEDLKARFWLNMPTRFAQKFEESEKGWYVNETYKRKSIDVPVVVGLRNFDKTFLLKFKHTDICNTQFRLNLENLVKSNAKKITPKCLLIKIINKDRIDSAKIVSGCDVVGRIGSERTCLGKIKSKLVLGVGSGWHRVQFNTGETILLERKDMSPIWPINRDDPWLKPHILGSNSCDITPQYRVASVRYCLDKSCVDKSRLVHIETKKSSIPDLPSLAAVDWRFRGLPRYIQFEIRKISGTGYANNIRPIVPVGGQKRLSSLIPRPRQSRTILPARVNDFGSVRADLNARFMLFPTLRQCRSATGPIGNQWRQYHPNFNGELKANQCTYAKIRKGLVDLSTCVLPKRSGRNWVYDIVKDSFKGKRHVILITNSRTFGGRKGRQIRKSLVGWLSRLKKSKSRKPVTIMSVRPDGTIRTVIRSEDLRDLKVKSSNSGDRTIRRLVSRLSFDGDGYRPLEHLVDFEAKIGSNLASLLYIADHSGIPNDEAVNNSQIGTTLGWSTDKKIRFNVFAAQRCSFWTNKARADSCVTLDRRGRNLNNLLRKISG
jgi:hypothetical protein